jgi:hypothetical protein
LENWISKYCQQGPEAAGRCRVPQVASKEGYHREHQEGGNAILQLGLVGLVTVHNVSSHLMKAPRMTSHSTLHHQLTTPQNWNQSHFLTFQTRNNRALNIRHAQPLLPNSINLSPYTCALWEMSDAFCYCFMLIDAACEFGG